MTVQIVRHVKVAVVGGGIAGLNAAYQLKSRGISVDLFESSGRIGGRIWSDQDIQGVPFERGAEFINEEHHELVQLTAELGLELFPTYMLANQRAPVCGYQYGDVYHTDGDFAYEVQPLLQQIAQENRLMRGADGQAHLYRLDHLPASDFLAQVDMAPWARAMVELFMVAEMGADLCEQPALNLWALETLSASPPRVVHEGYGKYIVKGGTERITQALAKKIESQIALDHHLECVRETLHGFSLSFQGHRSEVTADHLILAVPFSTLRYVDLRGVEISDQKRKAIHELGYGTNGKVIVGYSEDVARSRAVSEVFSHEAQGFVWKSGRYSFQPGSSLTIYRGGSPGAAITERIEGPNASRIISALDAAYPNSAAHYNNIILGVNWANNPNSLGSYSCMRPGQKTELGASLTAAEKHILFAGEHVAPTSRGFMNGAALSGRLAAEAIAQRL